MLFEPKGSLTVSEKRLFAQSVLDVCIRLRSVRRVSLGRRTVVDAGYERSFGDKTYEYSAVFEFDTTEQLKSYLTDPLHEELGRLFWASCERAVVCETESIDPNRSDAVDALVL